MGGFGHVTILIPNFQGLRTKYEGKKRVADYDSHCYASKTNKTRCCVLKLLAKSFCQALFSAVDDDSAQTPARNIHQPMIFGQQPFPGKKSNSLKVLCSFPPIGFYCFDS